MNIAIPIICIVVLAFLGVPIWLAMICGLIPYFGMLEAIPAQIIMQRVINTVESASYLAIPLFVTSGVIMNYAGISGRLLDLADALVGHLAGGLGHCNVLLSVLMGGVSGSAAADAAMESKILVPEMEKRGYDREFSGAVTIASSLITPIIPPGMGLIMYAFATNTSVGQMFLAGYAPGLLAMVLQMIYVYRVSKKRGYKGSRTKMASAKEIGRLTWRAVPALILPFGLIMMLRFGMATATEVGAICAVYALFVGTFIYREIKFRHVWKMFVESVTGTATVMVLIAAAQPLSYFMTYEGIPQKLASSILDSGMSKWSFVLLVNVILLVIGMFMEGGAPLIILAPLLAPIAVKMGYPAVTLGILMDFNLTVGNMTPPFGIVLYQVRGILNANFSKLVKECIPFIVIMLIVLAVISYFPDFTMFLPRLVYGLK